MLDQGLCKTCEDVLLSAEDLRARTSHLFSYVGCLSAAHADDDEYAREEASLGLLSAKLGKFGVEVHRGLKEVPDDKMVVLGLVTTKSPALEKRRDLVARIAEASRYVPRERLALSPQCGFSTSIVGNRLTVDDQRRKLRRIAEVAAAVWG